MNDEFDASIEQILDSWIRGLYFAMPGIITEFSDRAAPRISVQSAFAEVFDDSALVPINPKIIKDVPLVLPGGSNFVLTIDQVVGDQVLLLTAQRSIAAWFTTGAVTDPMLNHVLDVSDVIAIPSLFPLPKTLAAPVAANKMELRLRDGTAGISLALTGEVSAFNAAGAITLSVTGQVDVNGNFTVDP